MTATSPFLLLDVGNSAIKWRLGDARGLRQEGGESNTVAALCTALAGNDWYHVALASVAGDEPDSELIGALQSLRHTPVWHAVPQRACLGVTNSYADPHTMGVDRWVAMIGAWCEFGGPLCVVDAGTAITVDLLDGDGQHEGGFILPGVDLMRRALSSGTGRIRVDALSAPDITPGTSTQACVSAGVWRATVGAIRVLLSDFADHRAVITGGHASLLLSLGVVADARPDLVLEGLRLSLIQRLDDRSP
jgi:type III pantothenate kinase